MWNFVAVLDATNVFLPFPFVFLATGALRVTFCGAFSLSIRIVLCSCNTEIVATIEDCWCCNA